MNTGARHLHRRDEQAFLCMANLSFLTCDPYPIRYDIFFKGVVMKIFLFPIMHWGHDLDILLERSYVYDFH